MFNELGFKAYFAMQNAKRNFTDFMKKERGGSEIIAIVIVIAIVLVLAGIFWEKISEFFGNLMGTMLNNNETGKIGKDGISIPQPTAK